jgi:hypothetical protein
VRAGLGQQAFFLHAHRQGFVQPGVGRGIAQTRLLFMQLRHRGLVELDLLGRGFDAALQFAPARGHGAGAELRFLRLTLLRTRLLAGLVQLALGLHHRFFELGVLLLRIGQTQVQLFKACLAGGTALLQLVQLRIDLGQLFGDLPVTGLGLLGLLGQAQDFHLQLVGALLYFAGLATRCGQAL